jgi:hypothetical protein
MLQGIQLRVITGPGRMQLCSAGCLEIIEYITIRVENTDSRDWLVWQLFLPSGFAHEIFGCEDRRFGIVFVLYQWRGRPF